MLPHRDIVRHLYQIIDFSAGPDSSGSKTCPINRTVSSDIYIRFSDDIPNLRYTLVLPLHRSITVAIRTDHTAREEAVAFTDDASIRYGDLRKQMTFLPDSRFATDRNMVFQNSLCPDLSTCRNIAKCTNARAWIHDCGILHMRGRMDASRRAGIKIVFDVAANQSEGVTGVLQQDEKLRVPGLTLIVLGQKQYRGPAIRHLTTVFRITQKRQIPRIAIRE